MKKLALKKGGVCVSKTYEAIYSPLVWDCKQGHPTWLATPASIANGSWCRRCVRAKIAASQRNSISEYEKIAKARGGRLLSKEYKNNAQKLHWECALGHDWYARALHIKRGSWCRDCATGIGERICREYFEQLFGFKFYKIRPPWLIGPGGKPLELDGYCEKLKIAFEHHGAQHFSKKTIFITSDRALKDRRNVDRLKRRICKKNGVRLIEISEVPTRTPIKEIKSEIRDQCRRLCIRLPDNFWKKEVILRDVYSPKDLIKLSKLAKRRGGKLLSKQFLGVMVPHEWECANKHTWFARPNGVTRGSWCSACAGSKKLTIDQIQAAAKKLGGECLTKRYVNSANRIWLRCKNNHTWSSTGARLRRGAWCSSCAGNVKKTIKEMRAIARKNHGLCLSKRYINSKTKLRWLCSEGHRFSLEPASLRVGGWCQKCAIARRVDRTRFGLKAIQNLAKVRDGKCLSREYVDNKSPLLWKCRFGHKWEASSGNVKNQKTWCRICAGKKPVKKSK
jgi:hypothetical protein